MGDIKEAIKNSTNYEGGDPRSQFKLTYDAQTNQIEPVYYWILDFLQDMGVKVEKVTDNYRASPGSGQFQEMGQKMGINQQSFERYSAAINQVAKSILQLLYDLKEFEIRIEHYKDAKGENGKEKIEEGNLALKQVWLDNVDLKRGRGSIHQMAAELGYTTLREAFMMANSIEDAKKMSGKDGVLNDQVLRVLIPRMSEYFKWKELSEKELSKRFNIEKNYLSSQVETLKLYTNWARPYLKAAQELKQEGFENDPALVNAFSTTMFELVLFGKKEEKFMPPGASGYKTKRQYYSCVVVDMIYRGHVGQRVTQKGDYAYGFGGRVDMTFSSYVLNEEELELMKKKMDEQDLEDGLDFLKENTEDSLAQLKEDIEHFLNDDKAEEKKEKKKQDDTNPFTALASIFTKALKKSEEKKDGKKKEINAVSDMQKENWIEKEIRSVGEESAKSMTLTVYDIYKKSHGMASTPENLDN